MALPSHTAWEGKDITTAPRGRSTTLTERQDAVASAAMELSDIEVRVATVWYRGGSCTAPPPLPACLALIYVGR